jgi:hypothetical protein
LYLLRNEFTDIGYVKLGCHHYSTPGNREHRFALEYERTAKAKRHYQRIWKRIEAEIDLSHFLYLTPNHDFSLID